MSDESDAVMIERFAKIARDELAALPSRMTGGSPAERAKMVHEVRRVAARVDNVLLAKADELRRRATELK
jgi:hypothetical protein